MSRNQFFPFLIEPPDPGNSHRALFILPSHEIFLKTSSSSVDLSSRGECDVENIIEMNRSTCRRPLLFFGTRFITLRASDTSIINPYVIGESISLISREAVYSSCYSSFFLLCRRNALMARHL